MLYPKAADYITKIIEMFKQEPIVKERQNSRFKSFLDIENKLENVEKRKRDLARLHELKHMRASNLYNAERALDIPPPSPSISRPSPPPPPQLASRVVDKLNNGGGTENQLDSEGGTSGTPPLEQTPLGTVPDNNTQDSYEEEEEDSHQDSSHRGDPHI